jgi:hypothetical protein
MLINKLAAVNFKKMNGTNAVVSGSGTASDPTTFEFHETAQSYGASWIFFSVAVLMLGLAMAVGFLLEFYFGKRGKKSY